MAEMIRQNIDLSFPPTPPSSLDRCPAHGISFRAGFGPLCPPSPFPGCYRDDIRWGGTGAKETWVRSEKDACWLLSISTDYKGDQKATGNQNDVVFFVYLFVSLAASFIFSSSPSFSLHSLSRGHRILESQNGLSWKRT